MKYKQTYTLPSMVNDGLKQASGLQDKYDGIAEVWFESEAAFIEKTSSEEGQKALAALYNDEINFIDHSKTSAFLATEQFIEL